MQSILNFATFSFSIFFFFGKTLYVYFWFLISNPTEIFQMYFLITRRFFSMSSAIIARIVLIAFIRLKNNHYQKNGQQIKNPIPL